MFCEAAILDEDEALLDEATTPEAVAFSLCALLEAAAALVISAGVLVRAVERSVADLLDGVATVRVETVGRVEVETVFSDVLVATVDLAAAVRGVPAVLVGRAVAFVVGRVVVGVVRAGAVREVVFAVRDGTGVATFPGDTVGLPDVGTVLFVDVRVATVGRDVVAVGRVAVDGLEVFVSLLLSAINSPKKCSCLRNIIHVPHAKIKCNKKLLT